MPWCRQLSVMLVVGLMSTLSATGKAIEIARDKYSVGQKAPKAFVPYVASHPLADSNDQITRILFSIHSSGFDAQEYYDNAIAAAKKAPGAARETLIIAPQLFEQAAIPGTIPDRMLFWRVSPFRGSSRGAIGPRVEPVDISPFDVLDEWLTSLVESQQYPRLKDVVLVGHSGGGQLVQRYAMVGKFEPGDKITCRYVVSAPSSYAYPSAERLDTRTKRFAVPDQATIARCPDYDNWGYGLAAPYGYFKDEDSKAVDRRYGKRHVFYLCGSKDNDPADATIGTSCGAMMQGRHRLERMQVFAAYIEKHYGAAAKQTHRFATVRGIGHWGQGTMTSADGVKALFSPIP